MSVCLSIHLSQTVVCLCVSVCCTGDPWLMARFIAIFWVSTFLRPNSKVKASVPRASNKLDEWVGEWLSELSMRLFSMSYLSNWGCERNIIWHKGSLRGEDDVRTSNACIAQRKRAVAYHTQRWKCIGTCDVCCSDGAL